jgi:hypothetical protein
VCVCVCVCVCVRVCVCVCVCVIPMGEKMNTGKGLLCFAALRLTAALVWPFSQDRRWGIRLLQG